MQVTVGLAPAVKQNDCAFLVKLPVEIRHRIYELIFEDKVIAFMLSGGPKLRHCVCPSKGQKYHFLGYKIQDGSWCDCLIHDKDSTSKRLPLLLTCRQIYFESVDILWSHNTIHLQIMDSTDLRILSDLKSVLSPRSFHAIRSLEISFLHASLDRRIQILDEKWFDQWTGMWKGVKLAKGLLNIQAWVKMDQVSGNMLTADQEARLLAPLMELNCMRAFNVEVTWPENEASEALLVDAPFHMARNDDPIPDKPELVVETVDCSLGSS